MRERNYALTEEERAIVRTWQSATQLRAIVAGYLSYSAFASCWQRFVEPSLAKRKSPTSVFVAASRVGGAAAVGAYAAFAVVKIQTREIVRQLCVVGEEDSNLGGEVRAIVKELAPLDPYVNGGAHNGGGLMKWPFAMGGGAGSRAGGGRRTREAAAAAAAKTSAANDDHEDDAQLSFSGASASARRVPERAVPPARFRGGDDRDGSSSTSAAPFRALGGVFGGSRGVDAWGLESDAASEDAARRAAEKRAKYRGVGNSASRAREDIERRKLQTRLEHRARIAASRRAVDGERGEGAFARSGSARDALDETRSRRDPAGVPRRGVRRTAYGDEMDR